MRTYSKTTVFKKQLIVRAVVLAILSIMTSSCVSSPKDEPPEVQPQFKRRSPLSERPL